MRTTCRKNAFISLSGPHPTFIITVADPESGKKSAITMAWTTPLSVRPPLFGIAITPRKATHDAIERAKVFTINIPSKDIQSETWWIGTHTGRNYDDKISAAGLTYLPGKIDKNAISIQEAIASIECRVVEQFSVGDHTLFVGEVVSVDASEEFFDIERGLWIPEAVERIFHLAYDVFVFSQKEKVAR